jgi:glycosyltransferase involved in cell wall biosynthesis
MLVALKKVLLVTNIPTPYRIPLFNELNRQLKELGISLKILFGALGYSRRQWNINISECEFDYSVLSGRGIPRGNPENTSFTYKGLSRFIKKENPDLIITNGFSIATMKLWLRSWLRSTPYVIWSGSIPDEERRDAFLRRLQRQMLLRRAKGFVAYGMKAKHYLVKMGANSNQVQIAINTVDTRFYAEETAKARNLRPGGNGKKHLLFIGYLVPRKDVIKILKVIERLSESRSDFVLDIVGDGDDRGRLEKHVLDNRLSSLVAFHGYKQKSELPFFMAQAQCFLFQTAFDIWGLVLIEAMAAGVPCIASIHAGAIEDLIQEGITGFAMDFSATDEVAKKINWILDNPQAAKEIGRNAGRFIAQHATLEKSAAGFVKAITEA